MKDLEKIKSEDLACQVQDANPANFAIEQEVAQLVGATVPQPTQPSADDARELGAQLLVFLRRALLPIRSALRTAVAAIYAHLDSRCTDYTPAAYAPYSAARRAYDPMGTLPARSVANLLTALTAFSARKISGADVPDGISLQHILGSDEGLAAVANLSDDNEWVMNRGISFPNVSRIENNAQSFFKEIEPAYTIFGGQHKELILPNMEWTTYPAVVRDGSNTYNRYNRHTLSESTVLETLYAPKLRGVSWIVDGAQGLEVLSLPELEFIGISGYNRHAAIHNCANLREINLPKLSYLQGWYSFGGIWANCPKLEKVVLGTLHQWYLNAYNDRTYNSDDLIHFEIGEGTAISLNFAWWSPTNVLADADKTATFLQNFRDHIALRLTANGSGLTLTLSQAVRDAIHAAEATYGIEAIIVTQKGWTLSPAPGASSQ